MKGRERKRDGEGRRRGGRGMGKEREGKGKISNERDEIKKSSFFKR